MAGARNEQRRATAPPRRAPHAWNVASDQWQTEVLELPRTVLYERLCPSEEPTLEPREGDCLTTLCATEVQACRDARCPSDVALSSCETRLTAGGGIGTFSACRSYDGTDPCLYDSSFPCIEAGTAADALIDCIRNNCVGRCP